MIWIAAIKGYTNRFFSKLCRYTFTGNTVRVEYYYYSMVVAIDSGIKVGMNTHTPRCYMGDEDKLCDIQCPAGIAGPPTVFDGTWTCNGPTRTITWSSGGTETWVADGVKWTLAAASYCPNDCWGWAFDVDATAGQLDYTKTFTGQYQRYNGWNKINEPLSSDVFVMSILKLTTSGALRCVEWDNPARSWIYRYMAFVADRVIYQVSHDFNGDGKVNGEKGHTYVGYPIFQSGQHRGFVFADASEVVGGTGTFSAMYYYG